MNPLYLLADGGRGDDINYSDGKRSQAGKFLSTALHKATFFRINKISVYKKYLKILYT